MLASLFLCKREQQIPKEIPQCGSSDGKHLAEIEIPFQFAVEHIHRQRVDAQANQGNGEILGIFCTNLRIGALEGPDAVEEIVGRGSKNETQNVAQVFVPLEPFLANKGNAEIDEYTRKTYYPEFYEFKQKLAGQSYL